VNKKGGLERNTSLQAAYIIGTFFCREARGLVNPIEGNKFLSLSFFFLSVLRTEAIVPEESYCYLTIQTQDVTEITREREPTIKKKKNIFIILDLSFCVT